MTSIDLSQVLAWVNDQRSTLGLPTLAELPKGRPASASSCVIARALSGVKPTLLRTKNITAYTGGSDTDIYVNGKRLRGTVVDHPKIVRDFIRDFDNGIYPELFA